MLHFTKKDFKIDWFSGTGSGGQHRNKHQNCCRITHIKSGLVSVGQSSKSRATNQREAFQTLAYKIIEYYGLSKQDAERVQTDNVVRTYHFDRGEASDGSISKPIGQVMDGDINEFIFNALRGHRPLRRTGRS